MTPDWKRIKAEYLRGGPGATFRGLAAKHGVPESTLTKRAIRECWADERQQVERKVAAELPAAIAEQSVKALADYLAGGLAALDVALAIAIEKIEAGELEFKTLGEAMSALARVVKAQSELAAMAGAEADSGEGLRLVIVDSGPDPSTLTNEQLEQRIAEGLERSRQTPPG